MSLRAAVAAYSLSRSATFCVTKVLSMPGCNPCCSGLQPSRAFTSLCPSHTASSLWRRFSPPGLLTEQPLSRALAAQAASQAVEEVVGTSPGGRSSHASEAATAGSAHSRAASADGGAQEASMSGRDRGHEGLLSLRRRNKAVTCDMTILAACVAELQEHWLPSKVDQVIQCDAFTLCLKLRNKAILAGAAEERRWMYLSWHQTLARICIGPTPERGSTAEAFSLAGQMASALKGLVLSSIELPREWERIVELQFGPRQDEVSHRLYLEVMANYSNLVLTDKEQRIVSCARQISSRMSSKRLLQTGSQYAFPPPQFSVPPSASETCAVWQLNLRGADTQQLGQTGAPLVLAAAMAQAYQGMSPMTARQVCLKAGVNSSLPLRMVTDEQWKALHSAWNAWIVAVQTRSFTVTQSSAGDGQFLTIGAFGVPAPGGVLEAVDSYYRMPQEQDGFAKLHQTVSSALDRALKRLETKREALRKQLDNADQAEATRKRADLIIAFLYRYERGADSLSVDDWETGEAACIPLDPGASAQEQAEELYKKAGKLGRTAGNVEPLLQQVAEDWEYLLEVQSQVQMLQSEDRGDLQALREIQEELVQRKFCKAAPDASLAAKGAAMGRKAKRKASTAGPDFRRLVSPSGFQVLVGRNNVQNDELTHRVASPTDLWFHARGVPGSHTVLRVPSGKSETFSDLQFAADGAAFFSKARSEGKADVVYAYVKDLKKPKGARPGQVLVSKEQVIVARPSSCPPLNPPMAA